MTPIAYTLKPQLEIPGPGTFVAIDAEFVLLVKEEIEITADGDRHVIKPVRRGLGRVSVLRVNGPDDGIPFIDDYITIHEPIGDYLTKWSGLQEQDLDPRRSSHALVSLKVAYKKLWLLLNLGCVFIGHGLINDFREANIHVPSPQVIDTSDLYLHKERKSSRLKLSFLTEFFLKEKIQTGNHDSIEDARSALHLWRKYQEFQEKGVVEQKLEEMYREGRKTNYGRDGGMVVKGHGKSGRVKGGSSVDAGLLGGRVTPDLGGGSGVDIVVGTPRGRREGETYFESPLR